jgi:CubicO group peptidase (beta-lactamase class C family)
MQKVTEERIRKVLRSSIEQGKTAGANLLVLKDGKEMLYMEEGMADREAGKEIRRDTIFRLYSMSKPVTAAAVMILVERGELDLLAPVSDYLPEYAKQYVEANGVMTKFNEPMKIIHLMNMTSGLAYGGGKPGTEQKTQRLLDECIRKLGTEDEVTTLELASRLGHLPLMFAPGCGWNYGLSADVLGAVIEKVSGMRLGNFWKRNCLHRSG